MIVLAKSGEAAKAGPIGLAVVLLLCVASYFLFKSMSKHLRNVRESFPEEPVDPLRPRRPQPPRRPPAPARPTRPVAPQPKGAPTEVTVVDPTVAAAGTDDAADPGAASGAPGRAEPQTGP